MTICQNAREGMTARLNEARELFSNIRQQELQGDELPRANFFSHTLRGLTYVSLYGAIEYTVTHGTQGFINYLCGLDVDTKHLENSLNSIVFDSHLRSVKDAGEKKKWAVRRAIFHELDTGKKCAIPDTVFGAFLHNVYPTTISEVFMCLGIDKPPTLELRELGYFEEITEKRNAVAHGRESASAIGVGLTHSDIEVRLNAAHSICSYFLDSVEEHAMNLSFIRAGYRSIYS